MSSTLTRALGEFAAGLRFEMIPAAALTTIKLGFTDCIAAIYAGAREPGVDLLRAHIGTRGLIREARLCGGGDEWASAAEAAMVNGMAGHVLDYDDIALGGHPSVVLVPAIIAEAQALGRDGRAALTAYLAGFETWARIIERERDQYHIKGWHPTSVMGPVAAAAAIANLRGLNTEQSTHAIGIAASLCSGLVANFGSMTKSFQVGWASSSGITAARLAASGFTASATALEDPVGLLNALSPQGAIDASLPDDLGRAWRILERGLLIKRYPMCGASHRSVDALLDLRREHHLQPADIKTIEARIGRTQATVLRSHRPVTVTEARFSMEFALAAALTTGKLGLAEFGDAVLARPEVQALIHKVIITPVEGQAEDEPIFAPFDVVVVETTDGRRLESPPIKHPRGHWALPLTRDEIWVKFADCTAQTLSAQAQEALFKQLATLEHCDVLDGMLA